MADEALKQRMSHVLIQEGDDLVCAVALDGRIRHANGAWERRLGLQADDLRGQSWLDIVHPADLGRTRSALRAMRDGETAVDFENRLIRLDGGVLFMHWRARRDGDHVYAVGRDTTAMRHAEHDRLGVLRGIGNEMAMPVTAILFQLEHLRGAGAVPVQSLELLTRNTDRLSQLVGHARDIAGAHAGAMALHKGRVDVGDVVRRVVGKLSRDVALHHLELETDITASPAIGDAERLAQAFTHLLRTAITRSPAQGLVSVRCTGTQGGNTVEIVDQGAALPADRQGMFAGTGAGAAGDISLYVSRLIVEAHGGRIEATARPEGGATFRVTLPGL